MFYVVETIPAKKGLPFDVISYIFDTPVEPGEMVNVPIRNKKTPALVVSCSPLEQEKEFVKHSGFKFKLVKNPKTKKLIYPDFIKALEKLQQIYPLPLSKLFYEFFPLAVSELDIELKQTKRSKEPFKMLLQQTKQERIENYKTHIREQFALGRSVFVLSPTIESAKHMYEACQKGIQNYTHLLHSKLSKKQIQQTWQKILTSAEPVAVFATKGFLSIPRHDIGLFIVEEESNFAYKSPDSFVDAKLLAQELAKAKNASILFGDLTASLYTFKKLKEKKLENSEDSINTFRNPTQIKIIDAGKILRKNTSVGEQRLIFTTEATKELKKKQNALIISGRLGLASSTICLDCGNALRCRRCGAVMSLFGKSSQRFFICKRCGEKRDAKTLCDYCGSWRLKAYGLGVETIHEAAESMFSNKQVLLFEEDSAKVRQKKLEEFFSNKDSVAVATPKFLNLLRDEQIPFCLIPSFEQFLSVPTFKAEEQVFRLIMTLKQHCKKIFIQTKLANHHLLKYISSGKISAFLQNELELRKTFKYPPYALFVNVSFYGSKNAVIKNMQNLLDQLQGYDVRVFQEVVPIKTSQYYLTAIFRFKNKPDEKFINAVKALYPKAKIDVEI